MKHSEMVTALAKPGVSVMRDLTPDSIHLLHMAVGMAGEVGELCEGFITGDVNLLFELGDIEFYFEGFQQGTGIRVDDNHKDDYYYGKGIGFLTERLSITVLKILDSVKKHAVYVKPLDHDLLVELMMQFRGILTAIYDHRGVKASPYIAKCANIQKLGKRYDGFKYSNQAAQERVDTIE